MSELKTETAVMRAINNQLKKLETPEAKGRVLNYVNSSVGEEIQRLTRERYIADKAAINVYEKTLTTEPS